MMMMMMMMMLLLIMLVVETSHHGSILLLSVAEKACDYSANDERREGTCQRKQRKMKRNQ